METRVLPITGSRAEALHAVGRYARLAGFAGLCALYLLVRYVVFGRRARRP